MRNDRGRLLTTAKTEDYRVLITTPNILSIFFYFFRTDILQTDIIFYFSFWNSDFFVKDIWCWWNHINFFTVNKSIFCKNWNILRNLNNETANPKKFRNHFLFVLKIFFLTNINRVGLEKSLWHFENKNKLNFFFIVVITVCLLISIFSIQTLCARKIIF